MKTLGKAVMVAIVASVLLSVGCGAKSPAAPTATTSVVNTTPTVTQKSTFTSKIVDSVTAAPLVGVTVTSTFADKTTATAVTDATGTVKFESTAGGFDMTIAQFGPYEGPYETTQKTGVTDVIRLFKPTGLNDSKSVAENLFGDNERGVYNNGISATSRLCADASLDATVLSADQKVIMQKAVDLARGISSRTITLTTSVDPTKSAFRVAFDPNIASAAQFQRFFTGNGGCITGGIMTFRSAEEFNLRTSGHETGHMLGFFHHLGLGLMGITGLVAWPEIAYSDLERENWKYLELMAPGTKWHRNDRSAITTIQSGVAKSQVIACDIK